MAITPPVTFKLKRLSLTNVDDAAGRWQLEGGQVFLKDEHVANYASHKRVVMGGTDAQNTAMLTMTIFFLGSQPPQNITLQGSHDFNSGKQVGSVSAASAGFSAFIDRSFTRSANTLKIS